MCVIIKHKHKHKSISSFEICHSDSRVKQAKAFSFYKAAANRAWATLSVVIFRFLAEYLDHSNNVNGKTSNIEIIYNSCNNNSKLSYILNTNNDIIRNFSRSNYVNENKKK